MTEPVSAQKDDLTAIFGTLGVDANTSVELPPDDPDAELEVPAGTEPAGAENQAEEKLEDVKDPAAEPPAAGTETTTPAVAPAKEQHIPPAVAKKLRQDRREAQERLVEERVARAASEAELKVYKELAAKGILTTGHKSEQPVTEEKSPLEQFAEEFPDESPTTKVLLEQKKWEKDQQQQQAQRQRAEETGKTLHQQVSQGIEHARRQYAALGEGLGLDAVIGLAKNAGVLTEKDFNNCAPFGTDAGHQLYNLAVKRIQAQNGPALAELSRRVAAARIARPASPNVNGNSPKPKPTTNSAAPGNAGGGSPNDTSEISPVTRFIFSK